MKQGNFTDKKKSQIKNEIKPINRGFLKARDSDFDTTKSFLIISMIVAHSIQKMFISLYDRNLTYYVPIGFVFLSGLTLGGVFFDKLLSNRNQFSWHVLSRGLKLLIIFLILNLILILISPHLLKLLLSSKSSEIFLALINSERGGNNPSIFFSFVVLVPIAFTFIFGFTLLIWKNNKLDWALIALGIIALWIIEKTGNLDYYAVKLTIIGCIGILLAKMLHSANWLNMISKLSKWVIPIFICYIVYQAVLIVINQDAALLPQHYIFVTTLLLLTVYLTSYRLELTSFKMVELINRGLAKHMLFAYLFHILFLTILQKFVSRGNVYFTIVVSLLTIVVTTSAGLIVNAMTKKYRTFNKLYAFIFK